MHFYVTDYRVELVVQGRIRWHRHPGSMIHQHLKAALGKIDARVRDQLLAPLARDHTPHHLTPRGLIPILPRTGSGPQGWLTPGTQLDVRVRRFGRADRHVDQCIIDALELFDKALVAQSIGRTGPRERPVYVVDDPTPINRMSLRFTTPAHIEVKKKLQRTPDFSTLIRSIRRRLEAMCALHGHLPEDGSEKFREVLGNAEKVQSSGDLRLEEWQRGGNPRRAPHPIEGLLGKLTFTGRLGPFLGTLRAAEELHIGKMTSWGLGRINVGFDASAGS